MYDYTTIRQGDVLKIEMCHEFSPPAGEHSIVCAGIEKLGETKTEPLKYNLIRELTKNVG